MLFGAFSIDLTSGILLSLVILLHAIPQNLANSLMNRDSIKSPLITASGGVIGALSLFPFLSFGAPFESTILALTAINTG
ncbi:MAG TPA: hypothetical protein PK765_00530 [bacterium]|nr:hypothetical protein [bacterium]